MYSQVCTLPPSSSRGNSSSHKSSSSSSSMSLHASPSRFSDGRACCQVYSFLSASSRCLPNAISSFRRSFLSRGDVAGNSSTVALQPRCSVAVLVLLLAFAAVAVLLDVSLNTLQQRVQQQEQQVEAWEDRGGAWMFHVQYQSDFWIALAYFSIPLELLFFISRCPVFPFKYLIALFGAFIVLCGITHVNNIVSLLSFSPAVMVVTTAFKLLCALVSCITALVLVNVIPQLLSLKVREMFLKTKAEQLDAEICVARGQEEAGRTLLYLTREIRTSLDRHTILSTAVASLSRSLSLSNCAIFLPCRQNSHIELTHSFLSRRLPCNPIPCSDPTVGKLFSDQSSAAQVISSQSSLGEALALQIGQFYDQNSVAAVRIPLLSAKSVAEGMAEGESGRRAGEGEEEILGRTNRWGRGKGAATCEVNEQPQFAVLVAALPLMSARRWAQQRLLLLEMLAEELSTALSHAAVVSLLRSSRDRLRQQSEALACVQQRADDASAARDVFFSVVNQQLRSPLHSIVMMLQELEGFVLPSKEALLQQTRGRVLSLFKFLNDRFDLSLLQDHNLLLYFRPFFLPDLFATLSSLLHPMLQNKHLTIHFEIDPTVSVFVVADRPRLLQILTLLLENACKFGRERGHIKVAVNWEKEDVVEVASSDWLPSLGTIPEGAEVDLGEAGAREEKAAVGGILGWQVPKSKQQKGSVCNADDVLVDVDSHLLLPPRLPAPPPPAAAAAASCLAQQPPSSPSPAKPRIIFTSSSAMLRIEVTDDGMGMGGEQLQRLTQQMDLMRVEGGRLLQQQPGQGMGLAICAGLAHLHGGAISISSRGEGKGCTVTVRIMVGVGGGGDDGGEVGIQGEDALMTKIVKGDGCFVHREAKPGRDLGNEQEEEEGAKRERRGSVSPRSQQSHDPEALQIDPLTRQQIDARVVEAAPHVASVMQKVEMAAAGQSASAESLAWEEANVRCRLTGVTVLLVDDDAVCRLVTKRSLQYFGCEVMAVASGQEALSLLSLPSYSFDVLLLDLVMPDLDGYELAIRVHAAFSGESRPLIVALTANTERETRAR